MMFEQTNAFNQDMGDWNTSSMINIGDMFRDSAFNQSINKWDGPFTSMSNMFLGIICPIQTRDDPLNFPPILIGPTIGPPSLQITPFNHHR